MSREPSLQSSEAGQPVVLVVDDDVSVREALHALMRSVGLRAEVFRSAADLLESKLPDVASCLVLDLRLPGMSGLDLQARLALADIRIPVIFVTAYGDIPTAAKAMKAGAVDFLTKPFREQDLLDAISKALARDCARRSGERCLAGLRARLASLTPRERAVMDLVASGLMNKQIAARLGAAEATVKIHRARVMKKMGARSLADLVRMADAARACDQGRDPGVMTVLTGTGAEPGSSESAAARANRREPGNDLPGRRVLDGTLAEGPHGRLKHMPASSDATPQEDN